MNALVLEADWVPRPGAHVPAGAGPDRSATTASDVWRAPQVALAQRPDPTPGPDEVVLEVGACGICGSDLHMCETDPDGYMLYPGLARFPVVLGHEFAGRVVATGRAVRALRVGDLVAAEEMMWCGSCAVCRRGFPNHCEHLEEIGFTVDGALARYVRIGERYCWPLTRVAESSGSESLACELGALVEPTAVSYHALFSRAGGFAPGARVAVFGAGPIGLTVVALARAAGASDIVAFETSAPRRALATRAGADASFDPAAVAPGELLLERSRGEGFDVHVEAAGAPAAVLAEVDKALAVNAKVIDLGRAAQPAPIRLETFQRRGAQFFGSQGHSGHGNFANVIRLMASGRLRWQSVASLQQAALHEWSGSSRHSRG